MSKRCMSLAGRGGVSDEYGFKTAYFVQGHGLVTEELRKETFTGNVHSMGGGDIPAPYCCRRRWNERT